MAEYIEMERHEAYWILGHMYDEATAEQKRAIEMGMDALELLDLMPDNLAIVCRCKDCKHFYRDTDGDFACELPRGLVSPTEDSSCSYGERGDG